MRLSHQPSLFHMHRARCVLPNQAVERTPGKSQRPPRGTSCGWRRYGRPALDVTGGCAVRVKAIQPLAQLSDTVLFPEVARGLNLCVSSSCKSTAARSSSTWAPTARFASCPRRRSGSRTHHLCGRSRHRRLRSHTLPLSSFGATIPRTSALPSAIRAQLLSAFGNRSRHSQQSMVQAGA